MQHHASFSTHSNEVEIEICIWDEFGQYVLAIVPICSGEEAYTTSYCNVGLGAPVTTSPCSFWNGFQAGWWPL
jgi:hypothetical protein